MTRGLWSRWATLIAVIAALALPAAAQAAPTWHLMPDPAPGGTGDPAVEPGQPRVSLAIANGRPYLATVSPSGVLTVHTLSASGTSWQQVGGALNKRPVVGDPVIAASGSAVWVAWREQAANGTLRVHVARLVGGRFQEVHGGLGQATTPPPEVYGSLGVFDLVIHQDRPYVVFRATSGGLRVVRLRSGGQSFEPVQAGLPTGDVLGAQLAIAGGRLYLAYTRGTNVAVTTQVSRLSTDGRSWQTVASAPAPATDGWVSDAAGNGTLYVAVGSVVQQLTAGGLVQVGAAPFGDDRVRSIAFARGELYAYGETEPGPDVAEQHLVVFRGGAWQPTPEPPWTGTRPPGGWDPDVDEAQLVGAGNSLWFAWDHAGGEHDWPRYVHVARWGD